MIRYLLKILSFLNSTYKRAVLYLVSLLLLLLLKFFHEAGELSVFNLSNLKTSSEPFSYDDREQHGNSVSQAQITNDGILFNYCLGGSFQYPYSGFSLKIPDAGTSLNDFNRILITVSTPVRTRLCLLLTEHNVHEGVLKIEQHLEYLLECQKGDKSYSLPISLFEIPSWWIKAKSGKTPGITLKNINTFSVQNDPGMANGVSTTVMVKEIKLTKKYPFYWYLITAVLVAITVTEIISSRKKIRIEYVPLEAGPSNKKEEWTVLADFIGKNYHEEIDLEDVALGTGIAKHRISVLIKEKSGFNFRQYINGIRITEAERLLKESALSVTETGYEVGFTNATHFNRVFKEIKGMAPSEYRKQVKINYK